MIKKVAIAGLIVVATSLAGCGQSSNDSASKSEVAEATTVAAPEVTQPLADNAVRPMSAQALAEVKPGTAACAFDSVDGNYSATQAKLDKSSPHVFRGWALAEDKHVAKDIDFVLKGSESFAITVKSGVVRQDVGSHFNDTNLNRAGFNFSVELKTVPVGVYKVFLVTELRGASYGCETKKSITII